MFSLTESHRFFLCQHYVDMRKGIDSLCSVVRSDMGMHPLTGDVFLFFPRHRRSVKVLRWDGDGFILYHKRLERGTFEIPPFDAASGVFRMPYTTLELIMRGVSLRSARYRNRMRISFF